MRAILIIIFFATLPSQSISQFLISPKHEDNIIPSIVYEKYKTLHSYESIQKVNIDLNVLASSFVVDCQIFQNKIHFSSINKMIRDVNNYTWFGSNEDDKSTITLIVQDQHIEGFISTNESVFKIETIDQNFFLIKLNQEEFNKTDCGSFFKSQNNNDEEINNIYHKPKTNNNKTIEDFKCKLRVLVLYTPNANANTSNMQAMVQLSIDQMNQTFINSFVNVEVELAHLQQTEYFESNVNPTSSSSHDNDLTRFTLNGDGYMDEVHSLRSQYSADICVLICDIPQTLNIAGVARSIKSSSQNAFCLVDYFYSYMAMTFAHEIGHIIGCRHNESSDGNNTPYSYGHGFTVDNPSEGSWRTIMGTNYSCNNCPRNPFWSNPNVWTPFGYAGTISTNNNARVINENIDNVLSFRPSNGHIFVDQIKANSSMGSSIYNSNKLTTQGDLIVPSNQSIAFYAGFEIEILPGFETEIGSQFVAEIVDNCGIPDNLGSDYGLSPDNVYLENMSVINYYSQSQEFKTHFMEVYPNPVNDVLNINLVLTENVSEIKVKIKDINGKIIQSVEDNLIIDKNVSYSISTVKLLEGFYFVSLYINNKNSYNFKFVKK